MDKQKEGPVAVIEKPKDVPPIWKKMNVPPALLEVIYGYAYKLFQRGSYDEARKYFLLLAGLDHTNSRYAFAAASCDHKNKRYQEAIGSYWRCTFLNPEDPLPYYHMSDCFLSLQQLDDAIVALQSAVKYSKNKKEHAVIYDRASVLLDCLEKGQLPNKEEKKKQ